MSDDNPQVPHGYYYVPLKGGEYENAGRQLGNDFSNMALNAVATFKWGNASSGVLSSVNDLLGNPVGTIGSEIGGGVGWYMDNLSNILQNLNTMVNELNDARSWNPYSDL